MTPSTDTPKINEFGVVNPNSDSFEFDIVSGADGRCRLASVIQTERGPRRTELAEVEGAIWRTISARVSRELVQDMGEGELLGKKLPVLKPGVNRLSLLVGRELALLLWALQEEGSTSQLEAVLHGWRELAREERWWLYAKAAAPGQRSGSGWRRGLFHALSEIPESRSAEVLSEKKSPKKKGSVSSAQRRVSLSRSQTPQPAINPQSTLDPLKSEIPPRPAAKRKKAIPAAIPN